MRKAQYTLGLLDDSDIDWMILVGARRRIEKGATLIQEGQDTDQVYIVVDGAFAVRIAALAGKDVAVLRAGEIVGEMSFVDSRPPSASVVAVADSSVLAIPRAVLQARLAEPTFAARFYRALAIFLANRMRSTVASFGYGKAPNERQSLDLGEEIGPTALENVNVAGARLDWMLRRLRGD